MTDDRYSRQVLLPFIGPDGQERISRACVAVVGLGALGCVASDLLVRSGVGHLRVVDRDLVELNNLQRQTLYTEADVGTPKAVAAQERLRKMNSEVEVEAQVKDVNYRTVMPLLEGVDLVVDGTDNLETRYLLNEACIKLHIPLIYGAALGMDGMTGTLWPPATPCFRCLFPTPPAPGSLPTCETAGILNSAAAVVGSLQASQALRYILQGKAEGCLYVVNAWDLGMERVAIRPREDCPTCVGGDSEYLEARRKRVVTQLCGRDAVSVDPLLESPLPLDELATRLRKAGKVKLTPHVLLLEIPPYSMTIFPDGRAVVKGTDDEKKALSLYARYVGV
jgi:adenylyltransferase/sulfurtransferase